MIHICKVWWSVLIGDPLSVSTYSCPWDYRTKCVVINQKITVKPIRLCNWNYFKLLKLTTTNFYYVPNWTVKNKWTWSSNICFSLTCHPSQVHFVQTMLSSRWRCLPGQGNEFLHAHWQNCCLAGHSKPWLYKTFTRQLNQKSKYSAIQ